MLLNMDVELGGIFLQNGTYDYDDNYEYKEDFEEKGRKSALMPVFYSLVLVVGLLGNGLLLAVLALKRRSWRMSDTFVLNMSVADILLLVTLPFWAAQATQGSGWGFKGVLCKINMAALNINFYCGILLLVCISVDLSLWNLHATQLFSQERPWLALMSCLLVWLTSLILSIPDWIFIVAKSDQGDKTLCVDRSEGDWLLLSRLPHHTLGFLLPAAAVVFCWSCILLRLQRGSKDGGKRRSVTLILPLVVVFFLCWMPYNITLIVDTARRRAKEPNKANGGGAQITALAFTAALGCLHACLRPLLYFGLCPNFRKRALATLRRTTAEAQSSLWDLGVGGEALPDQSHEGEELKQMTSADNQVPSSQC